MYNPTRSQARDFFFAAWAGYRAGTPLSDLERIAIEIIALHPEYHALLEARDPLRGQGGPAPRRSLCPIGEHCGFRTACPGTEPRASGSSARR